MIQSTAQFLMTDSVIAGIFVIAFLFELVVRLAGRVLVPWASCR